MASIRPPMKPLPTEMLAPGSLSNPGATTNTTVRPPTAPMPVQTPPIAAIGPVAPPPQNVGSLSQPYGTFTPPSAANFEHSPDFQYLLDQQAKARQRSAAARGTLLNTGTVAGLQRDAAGIAAGDYQSAFNRALAAYNTNRDTNAQNFGQDQARRDREESAARERARVDAENAARASRSNPGSVADGPQYGSMGPLVYGPAIADFASSVAQARQANAATANRQPAWAGLDVPTYRGASTGGGIGRRAFR